MIKKLKEKWGITSNFHLFIICVVFAITGSVSAIISGPVIDYLFEGLNINKYLKFILQLVVIMPIYQVLLLFFGFIFLIIILELSPTTLPFHLLGLKALIGEIESFFEFKLKIGP